MPTISRASIRSAFAPSLSERRTTYAAKYRISVAQAEAELTQQALRNIDSAHDERLGADDVQAQAFLRQLGAGASATDSLTGQTYQLFSADAATRDNHAMFGQYAKTSPSVMAALDRAYQSAYKPKDGQTIAGVNGSNPGALTGSDLALNDAARDYANMRQQPDVVQWTVLGELRSERRDNLQTQLQLTQELQGLNAAGDVSAQATQRRGDIITRLTQLQSEDQTLRQASVEQIRAMGSAGLINPADQREWIEGSGEAIAASGLAARSLSAASISGRINALKGAVEESRAMSAAAKAEADAIAQARIANNASRDGASYFAETYTNLKAATAQARTALGGAGTDAATGKPLGNVAVAQVNIDGQGSQMVSASSRVGNDPASAVPGYVTLPAEEKRILQPVQAARDPIPRSADTEYKILENFAQQNIANPNVGGTINMFTERAPCYSCTDVIRSQFNQLFPNIEVRIYHGNGAISSYRGGQMQTFRAPSSNSENWPAMPGH